MKGPLIENCYYITPTYDIDPVLMQKMGAWIEYHIEAEDHILVTVGSNASQRIEVEDTELRR